jgi:proton glutamate symport protein
MKPKVKTPWSILVSIILAILFGVWAGEDKGIFGVTYYFLLDLFGTIFLNSLTLIVVPLVSSSIITGMTRIGNEQSFSRLGGKMFMFYFGTSFLAILIGLLFVDIITPGSAISASATSSGAALAYQSGSETFSNFLIQIIPPNIIDVFSQGHMLSLICFSLVFGYAVSKIDSHLSASMLGFWQGLFQTMIQITQLLMKLLPYGIFCLVAKTFAATGLHSIASLILFFATSLISLAVFMFIGLPLLLKMIAGVSPIRHFKAMYPALMTAFSTSSSSVTLPITIDCVEKRAGVSNRICGLVVPLGTSINMSGSALYVCVAVMFVAQAYGVSIPVATQILIVFLSLITSIGVAGIPGAGLIAIIIVLKIVGLPTDGIGLFIAVDRLLDMCRSTVNVFSDSCCAVFVAASEGEHILTKDPD